MIKNLISFVFVASFSLFSFAQGVDAPALDYKNNAAIREESTSRISLDQIGIITPEHGGLGMNAWRGSDPYFVAELLKSLPQKLEADAAYHLKKRVLLSITKPIALGKSLFETRLKHLVLTGNIRSVNSMLKRVPPYLANSTIESIYIASLFYNDRYAEVCGVRNDDRSAFFRKVNAVCQAWKGQKNEANLTARLLREDKIPLSKDFLKAIKLLSSTSKKEEKMGKLKWKNELKNTILSTKITKKELPVSSAAYISELSNIEVRKWWDKNKDLSVRDQFKNSVKLHTMVSDVDKRFDKYVWEKLMLFAIANDFPIPDILASKILGKAVSDKLKGEVALLTIHILANNRPEDMNMNLISDIVESLNKVGLESDAQQLALDILTPNEKY